MKSAERELAEIERKKQSAETAAQGPKSRSTSELNKERIVDLEKQIDAETKKLANIRSQLQKAKPTGLRSKNSTTTTPNAAVAAVVAAAAESAAADKQQAKEAAASTRVGGIQQRPVPDELLPELCRLANTFLLIYV